MLTGKTDRWAKVELTRTRRVDGRSRGNTQRHNGDWEIMGDRTRALRCKYAEVMWHGEGDMEVEGGI
jgi:hypothetical protein